MDNQTQLSVNKSLKDGTSILKLRAKKRRTGVLEGDFWKKDETDLILSSPRYRFQALFLTQRELVAGYRGNNHFEA